MPLADEAHVLQNWKAVFDMMMMLMLMTCKWRRCPRKCHAHGAQEIRVRERCFGVYRKEWSKTTEKIKLFTPIQ